MSAVDTGYLILVIGSFAIFAVTLAFYSWYAN